MRKKFTYHLILLSGLVMLAVSCATDSLQPTGGETIPDHCIELTLNNLHPVVQTKADGTIAGEDDYNENLVRSVDCFFYPTGETGSSAVFKALGRSASAEVDNEGVTHYKVRIFFTDDDATSMFGETTQCEVYVICNSPLDYGEDTSVDALKEMVVETDFSTQVKQSAFVMPAVDPAVVTLSTDGEGNRTVTGSLDVRRSAAKIRFYLSVATVAHDELNQEWHLAEGSPMDIRMVNASKRGKVDGSYTVPSEALISTRYREIAVLENDELVEGRTDYKYSHAPFYSYPVSWPEEDDSSPLIVFRIPWIIKDNVEMRSYQIRPNLQDTKLEANHYYRTFVQVSSLGAEDGEDPVWIPEADYVVMDWIDMGIGSDGQGAVPSPLNRYNYLVVDQPEITLNNEETASFTYISSSSLSSIEIKKIEYYNNNLANPSLTWSDDPIIITEDEKTVETVIGSITVNKATPGILSFERSLDDVYSPVTIYATITNADGNSQDIKIIQNPSISLVRNTSAGDVFVNGYFARVSGATYATQWYPSVRTHKRVRSNNRYYYYYWDDETSSFVLLGTTRPTLPSGGSWVTVSDNSYYVVAGSTAFYRSSSEWGNQQVNGGDNDGNQSGAYGTVMGSTYTLDETIDQHFFTTEIAVSSFNETNDTFVANNTDRHYKIGDPRVVASTYYNWTNTSSFYMYLYYQGSTESFDSWSDPGSILIATQESADQDIIAPRFLISSGLNANSGLSFEEAVKRGATYQEAGYPAGRWRLPTEAEIAFIVARQRDGVIPNLYASDSYFWAGSGKVVYVPENAGTAISFSSPANNTTYSCRYVYDLWYWGDEPAETYVYHPNGHNTEY